MTKEKPKLILHVGLHKTGTTYIQNLYARNLGIFAELGYPPGPLFDEPKGRHHPLAQKLKVEGVDAFLSELRAFNQPGLISSENFVHWLFRTKEEKLHQFSSALMEIFDLRIVIFIRRQDFLKESVFAEVVKTGYKGSIEKENHYHYDFDKMIQRLEDHFGHDRIGLGVYRDIGPNDIQSEFFRLSGIAVDPAVLKPIPAQNVNMGRRKIALLARLEKKVPQRVRAIRNAIRASDLIKDDGIKYQMSPQARLNFLRPFLEGNLRLAKRFDLDAETTAYLTSDALHQVPWAPLPPFSEEELALLKP